MQPTIRSCLAAAFAVIGLGATTAPTFAAAAPVAMASMPAETRIPNTRHFDFVSKVNGHRYSIDVALPFEPAPAKGYKVLYVLDGYGYFASATEAVRGNDNTSGVIVVGIGYPDDDAFINRVLDTHKPLPPGSDVAPGFVTAVGIERQYDLSLPATDAVLAGQSIPGFPKLKPTDVGGLDDFLKMIETDVKPRVAALAPVDRDNQALFGHSLGGLAVVEALFTEPGAFRTFIAASPSIWWADNAVLANEAGFTAKLASGAVHPRVLITVGGEESQTPKLPPAMAAMKPQIDALIAKARMVENACDLAARLKAQHAAAPYEVADCAVFAGQQHGISPWPAIGRAVTFALAD